MSIIYYFLPGSMIIISGLMVFFLNQFNLFNSLLSLEFTSLGIYLLIINCMSYNLDFSLNLYFLVLLACEGCFGLTLLILSTFYYGSDYLKNMNLLLC